MTENKQYILEEEFRITSADTDFTRKLSVSALTNIFIQIAWHHAEEIGFGIDYLHQNGLAWVLARFHLKIESLPNWNDTVRLVTWPKGIRRLFYLRDLEVFNQQGQRISYATSEWLLIDIKSKRPKLQGPDEAIFNKNKDKHAINTEVENLKSPDGPSDTFNNRPHYSDIDLNQHLTTTSYIDWMFDTFDLEFLQKFECKELVVNFIREISFGENISIDRFELEENNSYFFILQGDCDQANFKGIIKF